MYYKICAYRKCTKKFKTDKKYKRFCCKRHSAAELRARNASGEMSIVTNMDIINEATYLSGLPSPTHAQFAPIG